MNGPKGTLDLGQGVEKARGAAGGVMSDFLSRYPQSTDQRCNFYSRHCFTFNAPFSSMTRLFPEDVQTFPV